MTVINTKIDNKFSSLKVGDQVIAIRGYTLYEGKPAPGDRGFVVNTGEYEQKACSNNVQVKFFGFNEPYDFSPRFLQKISNSRPVAADYYARTKEKAREWLYNHSFHNHGSTTAMIMDRTVMGWVGGPSVELEDILTDYMMDLDADFDPTECEPALRWQIEHIQQCMAYYKEETERLNTLLAEVRKEAATSESFLNVERNNHLVSIVQWQKDVEQLKAMLANKVLELDSMTELAKKRGDEIEHFQVQLAGCSVAANGGTKSAASKESYGWSPAYQDVLDLRLRHNELLEQIKSQKEEIVKLRTKIVNLQIYLRDMDII